MLRRSFRLSGELQDPRGTSRAQQLRVEHAPVRDVAEQNDHVAADAQAERTLREEHFSPDRPRRRNRIRREFSVVPRAILPRRTKLRRQ